MSDKYRNIVALAQGQIKKDQSIATIDGKFETYTRDGIQRGLGKLYLEWKALSDEKAVQQNPPPLTVERLRERNYDWVWVANLKNRIERVEKYVSGYGYVIARCNQVRVVDKCFEFVTYGEEWIAYAHKPGEV